MNIKLKAALITLSVILVGFITALVLNFLPTWAVAVIVLAFACYIIYTLSLAQLKFDQQIEEINQKYQK